MAKTRIANTTNDAFKNRNPWRNSSGPLYVTDKQRSLITALESITATPHRDLSGWKRADASDYIAVLQLRATKQRKG